MHPGYTVIMDSSAIKNNGGCKEGVVHGELCMEVFKELPSAMRDKYGTKMSGFAYVKGELRFMSFALNTGNKQL